MKPLLFLVACLSLCLPRLAAADEPMPVTSDTPAYCLTLAQRMEAAGTMPPTTRVLLEQGRDMCQRGHVRGGLARLRRAMMITRGDAE